jgi:hypothetical protein
MPQQILYNVHKRPQLATASSGAFGVRCATAHSIVFNGEFICSPKGLQMNSHECWGAWPRRGVLCEAWKAVPGFQNPRASHGPKLDLVTRFPVRLLGHGNPVDCLMDSATRNGCAALRVHRQPVPLGPPTRFPRRRPAAGKRSAFPTTGPFEWTAARVTDHVNLGPVIGLYCTIHSPRMEPLCLS